MKNITLVSAGIAAGIMLMLGGVAYAAQSVFIVQQGGTGLLYPATGFQSGTCLTGNGTGALGTTTCGGGSSGLSSTTPWTIGGLTWVTASGALSTVATSSLGGTSNIVARDANGNTHANNFEILQTGTAGTGSTTLTAASSGVQFFTSGGGNFTVILPDARTLNVGHSYYLNNNASGILWINGSGLNTTLFTVPAGGYSQIILQNNSFQAGQWDIHYFNPTNSQWGTAGLAVTGYLTVTGNATTTYLGATGINGSISASTPLTIDSGQSSGTNDFGNDIAITASNGGATSGRGGDINLTAGNGLGGGAVGGQIVIKSGVPGVVGKRGGVIIEDDTGTNAFQVGYTISGVANPAVLSTGGQLAYFDTSGLSQARIFSFPDAAGTFCLTTTCASAGSSLSTTSPWTAGQLAVVSSNKAVYSIATTTTGVAGDILAIDAFGHTQINYASTTAVSATNINLAGTVQPLAIAENANGAASSTNGCFPSGCAFAVHSVPIVIASSTLLYYGAYGTSGTTTTAIANPLHSSTLRSYFCKTDVGTVYVGFGTGSATTTETQCTSTGTNVSVSSNNTWTGRQTVFMDVGHEATNPNIITVTADVEDSN